MHHPAPSRLLAAAALCAGLAAPATALETPERQEAYADWRAEFQAGRCEIRTGGDGAGTFALTFDMGGVNAAASYLPIVYSDQPMPLRPDDGFELIVDGRITEFGTEMSYHDGEDGYGRHFVGAGLTAGFVPDLIAAFRAGDTLGVQVDHAGEAPILADGFSLAGFTASYLKASEWCHFDPDTLFRS